MTRVNNGGRYCIDIKTTLYFCSKSRNRKSRNAQLCVNRLQSAIVNYLFLIHSLLEQFKGQQICR